MKKTQLFVILSFTFLYLILPTQSSTIDAWGYAACIRYGEKLFLPHHLLYNAFGFLVVKILQVFHFQLDILAFMKSLNAIFAGMILYIFSKIQTLKEGEGQENVGILVFVASTFGLMRFATENENYIIPIFFSLLGTFYFLRFIKSENADNQINNNILLASFWASFACLFHQIHFWWWLGLGIGVFLENRKFRQISLFLVPALLVPCTYMCILFFHFGKNPFSFFELSHFVFEDFYKGNVDNSIHLQHFLLTPINFIRSFIQVHGNILLLIRYSNLWFIPLIMSVLLMGMGILNFPFREILHIKKYTILFFEKTMLLIFCFHLLFAFYSVGNAEFMVMLPILLALILSKMNIPPKTWLFFGLAMSVWNVGYGLFPNYYYKWNDEKMIQKWVKDEPNALLILNNKALIENQIYYFTGKELSLNLLHSPTQLKIKNQGVNEMKRVLLQKLAANEAVYTNAIENEKAMNRESFFEKGENAKFFAQLARYEKVDSMTCMTGKLYLWKLTKKP